jgi:hypothetical protein
MTSYSTGRSLTWTYSYYSGGFLKSKRDPYGKMTTYRRNERGTPIGIEVTGTGKKIRTDFSLNVNDRVMSISDPDTKLKTTIKRNRDGLFMGSTGPTGADLTLSRDAMGRITGSYAKFNDREISQTIYRDPETQLFAGSTTRTVTGPNYGAGLWGVTTEKVNIEREFDNNAFSEKVKTTQTITQGGRNASFTREIEVSKKSGKIPVVKVDDKNIGCAENCGS